jgi:hypothetical protein
VKFGDLKVGDVMTLAGERAVILAIEKPHPLDGCYWMFVWWIFGERRTSFDMLSPLYDLFPGSRVTSDGMTSFRQALDEMR